MKAHHSYIVPCGLALLAIGLFIRYHMDRRRFNRRGIGGLQHFATYNKGLLTTLAESFISIIGTLCLLAGLFLFAIAGINHLKF
jgi:hypothetical protein